MLINIRSKKSMLINVRLHNMFIVVRNRRGMLNWRVGYAIARDIFHNMIRSPLVHLLIVNHRKRSSFDSSNMLINVRLHSMFIVVRIRRGMLNWRVGYVIARDIFHNMIRSPLVHLLIVNQHKFPQLTFVLRQLMNYMQRTETSWTKECAISGKKGGAVAYNGVHEHLHLIGPHTLSKGGTNDIANSQHRTEETTL